jgi:anti-anti-sigma factor
MTVILEKDPLTINSMTTPDGIVVELTGTADLNMMSAMRSVLLGAAEETLSGPDKKALTVDLRQVDYIDSAGLSVLVAVAKALTPASGALRVFVSGGGQPDRALHLVRFDMIMSITRKPTLKTIA